MQAYTVNQLTYYLAICFLYKGAGYDKQLGEILNAEILPIVRDFDKNRNTGMETPSLMNT